VFTYKIYGITVESEIAIEELISAEDITKTDASIYFGPVNQKINNAVYEDDNIKYSKNEFYLHIKGIADFYVSDGTKIVVELENESILVQAKVFLLGSCLGILLAQRKTIAIHGGAVVVGGNSIIITGNTGAGKSTLTCAFRKEGYKFLADDVVALGEKEKGNIIAFPAFPQQKLCKDAIEKMGYKTEELVLIDEKREKYSIPLNNHFLMEAVSLKAIYELNSVDEDLVKLEELFGTNKFNTILKNIYRIETIRLDDFDPVYFKKCVEIAKSIKVYKLSRPKGKFTVDEQIKLIKASLC